MKILVVRFRQIGDAILASVICKSLKETFPNAQIDYVLYENISPLFENQEYLNEVITISEEERRNIFKYVKKAWKVTRKEYDIVIDIMSTPKSEVFTLFSRKAKYRIGRWKPKRGFTYTHSIPEPSSEYDKAEKFLKMLDPLIKDGIDVKLNPSYSLNFSDEEISDLRRRMIEAGVDFSKIIIPLAINSRREKKVYPIDLMKKLAESILDEFNCQIILYYSPNEKEFAKKFHEELNWNKNILSDIETKNIRELGALLSNCDIFIGNEGGPRHLAQGIGIPSFSIFSPSSNKRDWLSRGNVYHEGIEARDLADENYEKLSYEEKYRLITPEIILEKVREKMKLIKKK